ncbi:MAG: hypothetical protein JKY43_10175 [Phycisphaerales bacterium]|nr:hypothetical protein [Phycisphaerales bacterium]
MIHETAIIFDNVKIGKNVHIGPYCIIGAPAESKKYWGKDSEYGVIIDDNVIINGHNTIDAGTVRNTQIKNDAFIMKGVHIGHDVIVREGVTISPHAIIGGHVEIGCNTNIGMGVIIHQRVDVPAGCMIGMGGVVTKQSNLEANKVYFGNPIKFFRWNKK